MVFTAGRCLGFRPWPCLCPWLLLPVAPLYRSLSASPVNSLTDCEHERPSFSPGYKESYLQANRQPTTHLANNQAAGARLVLHYL